jgi:hypothetical protein
MDESDARTHQCLVLGALDRPVAHGGHQYRRRRGTVRFAIDIARGQEWRGKTLEAQILAPGSVLPRIVTSAPIRVPTSEGSSVSLDLEVDAAESRWLIVRISDPARPPDRRATGQFSTLGGAVVYSSPFWIEPA